MFIDASPQFCIPRIVVSNLDSLLFSCLWQDNVLVGMAAYAWEKWRGTASSPMAQGQWDLQDKRPYWGSTPPFSIFVKKTIAIAIHQKSLSFN